MEAVPNTLQSLPLEMLDMVLLKVVAKLIQSEWEATGYQIRTDVYVHLATVWSEWYNRLSTRWFNIVLQQRLERINPFAKYLEEPELETTIDVRQSVWGLALLNKELFVASYFVPSLSVYDPLTFKILRSIKLENGLRDIAASEPKNCLYLVDTSCVSVIDGGGKLLRQWTPPCYLCNLSVTLSGNVVVTCSANILEYDSEGTLLQTLSLDQEALDMPWHSILLSSGSFLVCQGWMGSKFHRVLTLDAEGRVVKSYGSKEGSEDRCLANPVHLVRDRDGCIFVADSGNDRVVLLTEGLVFSKCFLALGDVKLSRQPYRILLDEASRRLYVGTNEEKIHIFKVLK